MSVSFLENCLPEGNEKCDTKEEEEREEGRAGGNGKEKGRRGKGDIEKLDGKIRN